MPQHPHTTVRQMAAREIGRIAEIDRSEHVTLGYTARDGVITAEAVDWQVPAWAAEGAGPHSVRGMIEAWRPLVEAGGTLLGAFDSDCLAGVAIVRYQLTRSMAQLAVLFVSRPYRRQGIATQLLREVERLARADGAVSLYVSATPSASAVGFYIIRGFQPTAQPVPELFAKEPEDIHMVKPLMIEHPAIVLQTERLYVRPWRETDLAPLRALLTDPLVAEHYNKGGLPSPEEEIRSIWEWGLHERSGYTLGFFNCPLVYRDGDIVVGRAGINPLWSAENGFDTREPELEWALMPAYWGRGLATELGRALIRYGFEVAGFDHLLAFTVPNHAASIRVMQKIGMRFERQARFRGEAYVFYRVDRADYEQTAGTGRNLRGG